MSKRLSALFTSSDDSKALPTTPPSSSNPSSPASMRRHSPPAAHTRSPASSRLHKPAPAAASHSRSASASFNPNAEPTLPVLQAPTLSSLQQLQSRGGMPSPLLPPPPIAGSGYQSRSSSVDRSRPSTPNYSRPATPTLQLNGTPTTPSSPAGMGSAEKRSEKKSGLFGRSKKDDNAERGPPAWIAGEKRAYDHQALLDGRPIAEMWDETENGNCYIYLFPRGGIGKGASFKVDSAIFAASPVLTRLAFGDV
ncbi:hypothetical protein LTR53_006831, partial [Teratosphaeriaceae sp. CCFEE 6253]